MTEELKLIEAILEEKVRPNLRAHGGEVRIDHLEADRKTLYVKLLGQCAGCPSSDITNETLIGTEYADVDDVDEYFYLKVCGDSMKNIGMVDGSIVLFRKQQYAEENDVVACLVGGECATVKRFKRQKKNIYLIPENEDYSPIHLSTDDFESGEARILGVAVEIKIKL